MNQFISSSCAHVAMLQHHGAEHRHRGQRDDRPEMTMVTDRVMREFAEQPADHIGHEKQRDQLRSARSSSADDDSEASPAPIAFSAAWCGVSPVLDIARHVLDHHDRVVDGRTGRDGERHQRQIVEAEMPRCTNTSPPACRRATAAHRQAGDDRRRRRAAQEDEDHHDDQHHRHASSSNSTSATEGRESWWSGRSAR